MRELGTELDIVSLHRGNEEFDGLPVRCFEKWELFSLFYLLPYTLIFKWRKAGYILKAMLSRWPNDQMNLWENLLGFGAAIVLHGELKQERYDVVHCAWASAPAACGWLTSALSETPFTMGAHAYDVFEHGGDWLVREKVERAMLVHSSTRSAADQLESMGAEGDVHVIYRGLNALPTQQLLRENRNPLRIVCVARLVEKKGFPWQVKIYRALLDAGIDFEARIVGTGPLFAEIEELLRVAGVQEHVTLLGRMSQEDALEQLAWADVLFHTGVVAASGDRDGLPNVIPEAMASGAIVVASPVSGVVEAIEHEKTGLLCSVENAAAWVESCRNIQGNNALANSLVVEARSWVETHFVASMNTGSLLRSIRYKLNNR